MTQARTLWEEGRETGNAVVALGAALALTVVALDVAVSGHVSLVFDLCFVALCVALALLVRPTDFFVVGVLPPLLMGGLFALLATTDPAVLARADDGLLQATITGLSHHSGALVVGYGSCLVVLWVRRRVLGLDHAGRP